MLDKKNIEDLIAMTDFAIDVREKLRSTMAKQLADHEAYNHQHEEYITLGLRYKANDKLIKDYKNLRVKLRDIPNYIWECHKYERCK